MSFGLSRLIVPALGAASLFLQGCKPDAAVQEAGVSTHASALHSETQAVGSPQTSAGAEPIIVCFGDSLTAGLNIDPGATYPDDLQNTLTSKGYRYRVVNAGVSGETTKDGLARVSRVVARHPQIVIVEFGGNDGLRGLPVSETQRNLTTIVRTVQASGAEVALAGITLPPQFGGDYIRQFNSLFPAVAKDTHVPLLPFLLQDVYGVEGDIQDDGIHPTAQGAKQVTANVEKLITPMLHK